MYLVNEHVLSSNHMLCTLQVVSTCTIKIGRSGALQSSRRKQSLFHDLNHYLLTTMMSVLKKNKGVVKTYF